MQSPQSRQRLERRLSRRADLLEEARDQLSELLQLLDSDVAEDYRKYTQEIIAQINSEINP